MVVARHSLMAPARNAAPGARQLPLQHRRELEVALPAVGRLAAGQGDLVGDAAALPLPRFPGRGGLGALRGVELGGELSLRGFNGALEPLEDPDRVDALLVRQVLTVALQHLDPALDDLERGQRRSPFDCSCLVLELDHVPDPRTDHRH